MHSSASGHLGHLGPTAYLGMALRCSLRSWIEVSTRPCSSQKVRSCAREEAATAEPRSESGAGQEGVGGGVGWSGGCAHLEDARLGAGLLAGQVDAVAEAREHLVRAVTRRSGHAGGTNLRAPERQSGYRCAGPCCRAAYFCRPPQYSPRPCYLVKGSPLWSTVIPTSTNTAHYVLQLTQTIGCCG